MSSNKKEEATTAAAQAAEATKQRLLQAIERFEDEKSSRQLMLEVHVAALISPEDLVGRLIRVYWPDDDAWYLGTPISYDPTTGQHSMDYVDGTKENIYAAVERVRILLPAGEELPRAAPGALHAYCEVLETQAPILEQENAEKAALLRQRIEKLRALAAAAEDEVVDIESAVEDDVVEDDLETSQQPLCTGDLVWGQVKGFPPWPGVVVTKEHLLDGRTPAARDVKKYDTYVPIVYFGSWDHYWNRRATVMPFLKGTQKGFYVAKTIKRQQFAASICEISSFMNEGELPEAMFPCKDTPDEDSESDDDDGDENEDGRPVKRRKKKADPKSKWSSVSRDPGMPLQIGKSLKILSLGVVEWLHPSFHDEKSIWPVGYAAERKAATPASGGTVPIRHLCEILKAEDGSGPIFRVTPWGKSPVEGKTPHKAWMALFDPSLYDPDTTTTSTTTRTTTTTKIAAPSPFGGGVRQFGLTVAQVAVAITSLPNAERCERFAAWPDGTAPPPPPPLTVAERKLRLSYEMTMCRLPPGIKGIPAVAPPPGVCNVCWEEEEDEDDLILQCDKCAIFTHMGCYAVKEAPRGQLWLCDTCKMDATSSPPACPLCPILGGALKRTDCGRWAHPSCSLWLPETVLDAELSYHGLQGLLTGLSAVNHSRRKLLCQVCKLAHGACMQCCEPGCYASFHIMCAKQAGYLTQMVAESDSDDDDDEKDVEKDDDDDDGGDELLSHRKDTALVLNESTGVDATTTTLESVPSTSLSPGEPSGDENGQAAANGGVGSGKTVVDYTAAAAVKRSGDAKIAATCAVVDVIGDEQQVAASTDNIKTTATAATASTKEKKKPKKKKKMQTVMVRGKKKTVALEGTKINGTRLLVFCPKHSPPSSPTTKTVDNDNAKLPRTHSSHGTQHHHHSHHHQNETEVYQEVGTSGKDEHDLSSLGLAAAAVTKTVESGGVDDMETDTTTADGGGGGDGGVVVAVPTEKALKTASNAQKTPFSRTTWPSARLIPLDGALRRGPRAPEAMEAAAAKRYYVRATPLLIGGVVPVSPLENMKQQDDDDGDVTWTTSCYLNSRDSNKISESSAKNGIRVDPPPSSCTRHPRPVLNTPLSAVDGSVGGGGGDDATPMDVDVNVNDDDDTLIEEAECSSLIVATAPVVHSSSTTILSSSEKYHHMRATEALRISPGKSAIHGWGAFSRLPHSKDQMVIEYIGDLVRPSIADARERSMYDSLVGAGTYVFRLNLKECVDATRSGNLAHLLNHSCEPNCFSRTVPVWDDERNVGVDHVIIFAVRDIEAWEELTYDYRFSGEEKLTCNCGAPRCRGMVNKKMTERGGPVEPGTLVPQSEVKRLYA